MMTPRRIAHLASLTSLLVLLQLAGVAAAAPASPGVEVKLFLDPKVALDTNRPTRDVLAAFNVTEAPAEIRMQFLDSPTRELHEAGWNVRLRTVQGKDKVELTYKRRFRVLSGLDAALARAEKDGFDAGEKDYEAELEWGYQQKTLTFSKEEKVGDPTRGSMTLPSAAPARTLAVDKMPGKLKRSTNEGWAKKILSNANVYGPVTGHRWKGSHPRIDDEISIEVWVVPGAGGKGEERIVEVSFKKKKVDAEAIAKREALIELLEQKRWLLEKDVLKTKLILERGRRVP